MAYLGRKGASAPLTSADIPDGSVSAAKVAADVATQAEIDLKANLTNAALVTPNLGTPSAGVVTNLSGVLPVGVTGGSGLTALGTVTAGNISNTAIVYPAGHVIGFNSFDATSGSNITTSQNTGTDLTADTSIAITVKNTGSHMLIEFSTCTASKDTSGRMYAYIRRTITGGATTTLGGFADTDKGHGMVDVVNEFHSLSLMARDDHNQAVGTIITYFVRLMADDVGGGAYWRGGGSNHSGYVMEVLT